MALETLKNYKEIGGFKVFHVTDDTPWTHDPAYPIVIDHRENILMFKIQNGPIKENGVNGCQVDTAILTCSHVIDGLNKKFACSENPKALHHLEKALEQLDKRTRRREQRGIEGTNQEDPSPEGDAHC